MLSDEWLPRNRLLENFNMKWNGNGNAYDRGDYNSSFTLRAVELKNDKEWIFPSFTFGQVYLQFKCILVVQIHMHLSFLSNVNRKSYKQPEQMPHLCLHCLPCPKIQQNAKASQQNIQM